jgi:peptide/nickel transport system substrate-binding protein
MQKKPFNFPASRVIAGILLMVLVAGLAACGSTAPADTGDDQAPMQAATAPASEAAPTAIPSDAAAAPAADDQGRYGGIITAQNTGSVAHWSVWHCGSGGTCMAPTAPLYSGLVQYNGETADPLDIRGDLATEWGVSEDGTSYTFHLHETAKWWDGMPVTAEDVVFSLDEMVRDDVPRPRAGQFRPYYESSRVIDPKTVEVTLKFASAAFLQFQATEFVKIKPMHHFGNDLDMKKEENILGSGPFKLSEYKKDISIEYEKYEDYHMEGMPYVDGLQYFIIPDSSTTLAAYLSGQVMMTTHQNSNLNIREGEQLQQRLGDRATVHFPGPTNWVGLMMNTEREPFNDVRVRRAMHLVTHRQPFIDTFGNGRYYLGGPFPPDQWFSLSTEELSELPGYRETADGEKHPDDIAEAERLLTEAGYPDGFETTILAANFLGFPDHAQLSADQLRRYLNITAEVQPAEATAGYARYEGGDWEMGVHGNGFLILDPDAIIGGSYLATGTRNYSRWEPPRITELFNQQIRETDQTKRREIVQQMADYMRNEDSHVIIMHWSRLVFVVDNRIQNFNLPATFSSHNNKAHLWCDPAC